MGKDANGGSSDISDLGVRCNLSSSSSTTARKLVLYSKPGCCLCDGLGLKEKLNAAFSISSGPNSLHDVVLQVRDITTNPEWERAYQYEIPESWLKRTLMAKRKFCRGYRHV